MPIELTLVYQHQSEVEEQDQDWKNTEPGFKLTFGASHAFSEQSVVQGQAEIDEEEVAPKGMSLDAGLQQDTVSQGIDLPSGSSQPEETDTVLQAMEAFVQASPESLPGAATKVNSLCHDLGTVVQLQEGRGSFTPETPDCCVMNVMYFKKGTDGKAYVLPQTSVHYSGEQQLTMSQIKDVTKFSLSSMRFNKLAQAYPNVVKVEGPVHVAAWDSNNNSWDTPLDTPPSPKL